MSDHHVALTRVAVTLAAVMATTAPAHAGTSLLLLIDGSGSMTTPRPVGDRFDDAIAGARTAIHDVEIGLTDATKPLTVALYAFQGNSSSPIALTGGAFVSANDARDALDCLRPPNPLPQGLVCAQGPFAVGGGTPLAGGMCAAADTLFGRAGETKLMHISSDGEENTTTTGGCEGVNGTYNASTGWSAGSWQANVVNHFTGKGIATSTTLFVLPGLPFAPPTDPEGILSPKARSLAATAAASTGLTPLEQFFTTIAVATGGHLTVVRDDEPLPVAGDHNGDRCVDRSDAILVARAFGPVAPPLDGSFDLNFDGKVDFADYLIEASQITSTCGADPYVSAAPLVCSGSKRVVIDGRSITDGGVTIDARVSCQITIKNSLIVSGKSAITIVGTAAVIVDHSILVGQDAVLATDGAVVLSAANSVFHGATTVHGAFTYVNRGNNIFE